MNESTGGGPLQVVILAAGKGTRMKSDLAKVLHPLAGRPLLDHVLAAVRPLEPASILVVIGHQADEVERRWAGQGLVFVRQEPQNGTGHAVQVAASKLRPAGWTLVLNGDVPLLRTRTLAGLAERTMRQGLAAGLLTCVVSDAGAYGRIIKDESGSVRRVVEARDALPAELAVREYNAGVYCYRTESLLEVLPLLDADNDQGELYLTDTVKHLVASGQRVGGWPVEDLAEVVGVNTMAELQEAERLLGARAADRTRRPETG